MLPAASVVTASFKPVQPVEQPNAQRSAQPQTAETVRASAGEKAAGNVRTETAQALKAAEQYAVAARLRDQETIETTDRVVPDSESPTGPPPAFEESPLERQARVAFDPPEVPTADTSPSGEARENVGAASDARPVTPEPPPTPTERAEASFAETRSISTEPEPAKVDLEF